MNTMSPLRALVSTVSPAGPRGRLSILIFHRVLPEPDPLFPGEVDASQFDAICSWVANWFNTLPLHEACTRLRSGTLPSRALAITFDDGYADNHGLAMPILRRHGLTATFFIATGFLDGGRMWNDSVIEAVRRTQEQQLDLSGLGIQGLAVLPTTSNAERSKTIATILGAIKYLQAAERLRRVDEIVARAQASLPDGLMMSSAQVRSLHDAGMQLGPHTVSHPILARLAPDAARREIADSKRQLESIIAAPTTVFAYPNGRPVEDYTAESVALVRDLGFDAAVSTAWGAAHSASNLWELPRFTPWDRSKLRFGARMLRQLVA